MVEVLLPNRNPPAAGSLVVFAVPNANSEEAPVSAGAAAGAEAVGVGVPPNLKLAVCCAAEPASESDRRGEASFSVFEAGEAETGGRGLMLPPKTVSFLSAELPKLNPLVVPVLREKAPPPLPPLPPPPPLPPVVGVLLPKLKASVPKLGVFGF